MTIACAAEELQGQQGPLEEPPLSQQPASQRRRRRCRSQLHREVGFRQPIVVDEDGVIVVGHTRHKAALKLGLAEVPVHVAVGLTKAQLKTYRIADNQTARLSSWDEDKLVIELLALQEMEFDLNLTGFSADELTNQHPH